MAKVNVMAQLLLFPGLLAGRHRDIPNRLARWWLAEFLALFPPHLAEWLQGHGREVLVLAVEPDAFELRLLGDGRRPLASTRIQQSDYSPASIDEFLQTRGLERADVSIGIRLRADAFFRRTLLLPLEATSSLETIVVQDLTRKTPFRLQDIYHDYALRNSTEPSKVAVWQFVVQREFIDDAVATLGIDLDVVDFIDGQGDSREDSPEPRISVRRERNTRSSWMRKATAALVAGALTLTPATVALKYWRQNSVTEGLEAEIAATRVKAQQVRAALDQVEQKRTTILRIRSQKFGAPGLLDIWHEITQVVPPDSWLSELRLYEAPETRERRVAMVGHSAAAPSLIGLIDRSPLFADVSFTSAIALDPVEGRERFALQASVETIGGASKVAQ